MMRATPSRPAPDPRFTLPLVVGALILDALSALAGLWWVPFAAGLVLGLTPMRGRHALLYALLAGLLGWAAAFLWLAVRRPLGDAASVVAGILGLGSGVAVIVIALLFAALLGVAGAWLGLAVRGILVPHRNPYDFR